MNGPGEPGVESEVVDERGLRLSLDEERRPGARIKVVGVGGGGGNAVNRMALSLEGVDFVAVNTDAQALACNAAPVRLQIGDRLTKGLGAGADPAKGREAALDDTEQIIQALDGADMVFVAAGLGGGTGTGAAPVVASLASEMNALTIAVVTKPFAFEGKRRIVQAEAGLEALRESVDTVIVIPNERILTTIDATTSMTDAFALADDVLHQAVQGISDLITVPGLINLDFADVTAIMSRMGMAIMGTGYGDGENRAVEAAQRATSSPFLEDASVEGARGVIVNVTGGADLGLHEVNEATSIIRGAAHEDANIIFGAVVDPAMEGQIKITVIATGFEERPRPAGKTPVDLDQYAGWRDDGDEPAAATAVDPPAVGISRRLPLDLPAPAEAAAGETDEPLADEDDAAPDEPQDEPQDGTELPAFLRPA